MAKTKEPPDILAQIEGLARKDLVSLRAAMCELVEQAMERFRHSGLDIPAAARTIIDASGARLREEISNGECWTIATNSS